MRINPGSPYCEGMHSSLDIHEFANSGKTPIDKTDFSILL